MQYSIIALLAVELLFQIGSGWGQAGSELRIEAIRAKRTITRGVSVSGRESNETLLD